MSDTPKPAPEYSHETDADEEALDDLDETEFQELYGDIIESANGETLRQLDDKQIHEADPHLVWTVLDCDGKLYLAHGFCFVNRFGYVLATLPWHEDTPPRDYRY